MTNNGQIIQSLVSGDFHKILNGLDEKTYSMVYSKIQEIPERFFESNIRIDEEGKQKISLIQFFAQSYAMDDVKMNGYMEKYHIDSSDIRKLQGIVESIQIAREYGYIMHSHKKEKEKESLPYGFSLSSREQLDKAYPLWLAYLFANAKNPLGEITAKLKEDGVEHQYDANEILGIIQHTNELMEGRNDIEMKEFYLKTISDILGEEPIMNKRLVEIEK